jgi:hypothetical protein
VPRSDAEEGEEGGVPGTTALEAEDELAEKGLEMLAMQATAMPKAHASSSAKIRAGQGSMMCATLAPVSTGEGDRDWRRKHRDNRTIRRPLRSRPPRGRRRRNYLAGRNGISLANISR